MRVFIFLVIIAFMPSCKTDEFTYENWVAEELATKVINDSLYLGFRFGMSNKDWTDHSAVLNKQRKLLMGSNGVQSDITALKAPATFNFWVDFKSEELFRLFGNISFTAWAPWNDQYKSPELLKEALPLFEKWFGQSFREIKTEGQPTTFVSIAGNRKISLSLNGDQNVFVEFLNLAK